MARVRYRSLLGCLLATLAASLTLQHGASKAQCLYAAAPGRMEAESGKSKRCEDRKDPAGLGQDPDIRAVIEVLGLSALRIRFTGCEHGTFATEQTGLSTAPSYWISYPVLPASEKPAGTRNPYLAPITHELAHVLQISQKGNRNALLAERPMLSVELAADFITGVAFKRIQAIDSLNNFQQNIALVGLYKEPREDAHGTWEQRTWAFRRGVFYPAHPSPIAPQEADDRFVGTLFREIKNGAPSMERLSSGPLPDEFPGNKMSACAEVSRLYNALRDGRTTLGSCRAPHSALERVFADKLQKTSGEAICYLENPPAPIFKGYSCWQLKSMPGSLECFRPVDRRMVADHLDDKTIDASLAYRNAAAACGADVSVAVPTLMSFPVARLFKFEFGYTRSLGGGAGAPGAMHHGVASAHRPGETAGVGTIEFVSMFAKGVIVPPDQERPGEDIGAWRAAVDPMTDINRYFERVFREHKVPAVARIVSVDIRQREGGRAPTMSREAQVQRWQRAIASYFEREGYKRLRESALRMADGKSIYQALEEMRLSGDYQLAAMSPNMHFYGSQGAPGCTNKDHGMVAAIVFATELPADPADYGAVGVILTGAGDCGRNSPATHKYMKEIIDRSVDAVRTSLKEQS